VFHPQDDESQSTLIKSTQVYHICQSVIRNLTCHSVLPSIVLTYAVGDFFGWGAVVQLYNRYVCSPLNTM